MKRQEPEAIPQWDATDLAVNETEDLKNFFDERSCNWTSIHNQASVGTLVIVKEIQLSICLPLDRLGPTLSKESICFALITH